MATTRNATAWTEADSATFRRLHGEGKSLHAIAGEMGRSKATLSKYAAELGLSFDRTRTAAAAQALAIDGKARRLRITARMYDRMDAIQDRLEQTTFRAVLMSAGTQVPATLDFVPSQDERNLADTLSRYVASATKLEAVDATSGAETVVSLLAGIAGQLGLAQPIPQPEDSQP